VQNEHLQKDVKIKDFKFLCFHILLRFPPAVYHPRKDRKDGIYANL